MANKEQKSFDDDNKTIFSGDLNSEEREAVEIGEKRGKKMAMLDRPEHYGTIGNTNWIKYAKNLSFALGGCSGCEHFNPDHNDIVGAHCTLPQNAHCIR